MPGPLAYLQYGLGKLFSPIRGHDGKQIIFSAAFRDVSEPNMTLESPSCGPSGSRLLDQHTCLADDGKGGLPDLRWTPPAGRNVKEYVLICEDIDLPIPGLVIHHGLFYGILPTVNSATQADVLPAKTNDPKENVTVAGWKYVPNMMGSPYVGAAPPLGHGSHRYVFTIVALGEPLVLGASEKVTKDKIKEAMVGKVVGWGQWVGVFERPWPR